MTYIGFELVTFDSRTPGQTLYRVRAIIPLCQLIFTYDSFADILSSNHLANPYRFDPYLLPPAAPPCHPPTFWNN